MKTNLSALEFHYSEAINKHGARPQDIVFILNQANAESVPDALDATNFLQQKFPGVTIKFDDEFEGMESKVVFGLTNGNIGTSPSIIPVCLTRANEILVVFIEDFRDIFKDATERHVVKKSMYTATNSTSEPEMTNASAPAISASVKEASSILTSMA